MGHQSIEQRLSTRGYKPLEPFFVLREGQIADERNPGSVIRLDRKRLEKIAELQNNRIETTGDATPIIIGHTRRGLAEKDQPPLTGWAVKFELAPFFDTGTYGIQATPWAKDEDKVNFERFPRRSAELWTDPDLIDPISLLGANTPRFDLGPHQLHRQTSGGYQPRRPIILEMSDMPDEQDIDKPAGGNPGGSSANSSQSSEFQALKATVDKLVALLQPLLDEAGGAGAPPGGPGGGPDMGGPPGGGMPPGGGAPDMGGGMPPGGPGGMPPAAPVQAMAGASPAGGMNAMTPQQFSYGHQQVPAQFANGYGYYEPQTPNAAYPTARPAANPEVVQLQRQVEALQTHIATNETNQLLAEVSRQVVIDPARDFSRLIKLSKQEQQAEVAHWLQTRKPVEVPLPGSGMPMTPDQARAAATTPQPIQFARDGGGFVMPGDPSVGAGGPPQSSQDQLFELVRQNNGRVNLDTYAQIMKKNVAGSQGVQTKVL